MLQAWLRKAALVVLATLAVPASAQPYPARPIRLVVPWAPGGSTDVLARIVAQKFNEAWGQPVLVENRPGASGNLGSDLVAKAAPDGYTLLVGSMSTHAMNGALYAKMPFRPVEDFAPVAILAYVTNVLVAHPSVKAGSVTELIAFARANPGKLNYGSYSGVTQLMHTRLKSVKADTNLVNYKGEGPTVTDIMGGHVQLTFATPISTQALIKEGKLRALAILLPARSPLFPTVPTATEAGLPPLTAGTWAALFGPARLPADITAKMSREWNAALQKPDVREKIEKLGFDLAGSTPEELGSFVGEQLQAWSRAFREAGMNPE